LSGACFEPAFDDRRRLPGDDGVAKGADEIMAGGKPMTKHPAHVGFIRPRKEARTPRPVKVGSKEQPVPEMRRSGDASRKYGRPVGVAFSLKIIRGRTAVEAARASALTSPL
jgi:hypothetical protein